MDYTDEKFKLFVEELGIDFDSLDDDGKEHVYKTWLYKKDVTDTDTVEAACETEPEKVEAEVTEEHTGEFTEEKKDEDKKVEASGLRDARRRTANLYSSNVPSMTRSAAPDKNRVIEASMLLQHASGQQVEKAGYR